MKFLTDFTCRNLHGFARFPGDSTALVLLIADRPLKIKKNTRIKSTQSANLRQAANVVFKHCFAFQQALLFNKIQAGGILRAKITSVKLPNLVKISLTRAELLQMEDCQYRIFDLEF